MKKIRMLGAVLSFVVLTLVGCNNTDINTDSTKTNFEYNYQVFKTEEI